MRSASADLQKRHLRRRLGHAVDLDHGGAAARRLLDRVNGDRASAQDDRPGAREVDVGLEQADELRGDQGHQGHSIFGEGLSDLLDVEAIVDHGADSAYSGAGEDRKARHVMNGQAAEPPVLRAMPSPKAVPIAL